MHPEQLRPKRFPSGTRHDITRDKTRSKHLACLPQQQAIDLTTAGKTVATPGIVRRTSISVPVTQAFVAQARRRFQEFIRSGPACPVKSGALLPAFFPP